MTNQKEQDSKSKIKLKNIGATRIGVSTIGILGGAITMEHGFFETLQGNIPTPGIMINAIGPEQRFWEEGGEMAMTIIPNFLITGIVAIIVGIMIIFWSIRYLHKKYGSLGLFVLTIISLLVGGGIAFFVMGIPNSIISTRINKPLTMQKILPVKSLEPLSKIWTFSLIAVVIFSTIAVFIGIFGIPFLAASTTTSMAYFFGYLMIGFSILTYITGFAREIKNHTTST